MVLTTGEGGSPGAKATRPSLLIRLRDPRDEEAWRVFVETYTPLVYGYCRRRGLQASDIADVTQEVIVQVHHSIREFSYQPEKGRFRDWLGTVTRTKIIGFLRRDNRAGKGGGESAEAIIRQLEATESDSVWNEGFQARVLEVALSRARPGFEEATWLAFERSWVEGKSAKQVALELNVPIDVVYVAKSRVLKRLREEVECLAEDYPLLVAAGA
jgi:RNA polymerase sigma factor (sigma-70 family)